MTGMVDGIRCEVGGGSRKEKGIDPKICLRHWQGSSSTTRLFCRSIRKPRPWNGFRSDPKRISRTWTDGCLAYVAEARTDGKVEQV